MLTKEELNALRDSLPLLSPASEVAADEAAAGEAIPGGAIANGDTGVEIKHYLRAYGIDFSSAFPDASHRIGSVIAGGERLAVQVWRRPAAPATLLLVHGYFDHVGLFGHLVRFGLERGCNVVAFDLPGHGLSSGEPAAIGSFREYSAAVGAVLLATRELEGPRHVIAQSTGGAAIMEYLHDPVAGGFERVVLLAPLVRPAAWPLIAPLHGVLRFFTRTVRRGFPVNSHDAAFLEFLRRDPLQPRVIQLCWLSALKDWLAEFQRREPAEDELLVIQGDEDDTVDWKYNLPVIRRLFPRAEVYMLKTGRHHLANESAELRSQYLAVAAAYLFRKPVSQGNVR